MGIIKRIFDRIKNKGTDAKGRPLRRVLPRGAFPDGSRTAKAPGFATDDIAAFIGGEVLSLTSSWADAAQYDLDNEEMIIRFLDGHMERYEMVSEQEAIGLVTAPSKGGWIHDVLLGLNWSPKLRNGIKPSHAVSNWKAIVVD